MSLALLFNSSRNRRIAAISAFVLVWIEGIYKMGMGDHFLTRTIVTMLIAFLFILLLDRFMH